MPFWDVLPLPHRCPDSGLTVLAKGMVAMCLWWAALPAAPGMHMCWEQLPSLCLGVGLGLPAREA